MTLKTLKSLLNTLQLNGIDLENLPIKIVTHLEQHDLTEDALYIHHDIEGHPSLVIDATE